MFSDKTIEESMMIRKDWLDLGLNKNENLGNPAFIEKFIEICWPDPFKDEDFSLIG